MLQEVPGSSDTREGPENSGDENGPKKRRVAGRFRQSVARGLSGRLLLLTIVFVMIAEVLIFVPSVANFRNVWLQNHLDTAESASIVYLDDSDTMLSREAQEDLLKATRALSVSIRDGYTKRLMAAMPMEGMVGEDITLGVMQPLVSLRSALSTLFFGGDRIYRVSGPMKSRDARIELIQEDRYLRDALLTYSRNILLISLVISLITAGLVFLALYWMIVRPIIRLSSNMDEFSMHPENSALVYQPTGRRDEIGIAEERLSALQADLQETLRQKQHLAELGLAVSKINHDLRNILASAYLFSDRLQGVEDPTVQRLAPKLVKTIDRAVEYTRSVLAYGKAKESAPQFREHELFQIIDDVADTLTAQFEGFDFVNAVPPGMPIHCDSEHIFRVVLNLCRNAVQAMENAVVDPAKRRVTVTAENTGDRICVRVSDTGPGIPPERQAKLFAAFQSSGKSGGTGLGLAIAAELVRAHGGTLSLESSSGEGATFLIELPMKNG